MSIKHKDNKNLTILTEASFSGCQLMSSLDYVTEYLVSIESTIKKAIQEHPKSLVVRFDLRFPQGFHCPDTPSLYEPGAISRFFASLEARFKANFKKRERVNKRTHPTTIRYVWVKERYKSDSPHFHCAIFLNYHAYRTLGVVEHGNNHVATRIFDAWCSALNLDLFDRKIGLVHFPKKNPVHRLNANHESYPSDYCKVLCGLSYLAKTKTKHYGNRGNSFGCSKK